VVNRKVVGNQALPERRFVMIAVRRRTVFAAAVAFALAALSTNTALASPGDLDITFGGVGKVTTDFTKGFDAANAVAIEADGKIVAAGVAKNGQVFALARYNSDGILDTTFGDHGKVTTNFTAENDVAKGVAMQDDGKIVGVGQAGNGPRFVLARYDPDGSLDPSFGGDGKVSTSFATKGGDAASSVAIQADGKIVAAGTAHTYCTCEKYAVARYNSDGRLDTSFGGDGKVTVHFKGGGEAGATAIGSDGKIVVVGGSVPDVDKFQVARFNADGTLDTTFGGDGKVTTNMGQGEESATGVAIQANGMVAVVGYTDLPHEGGETFGPAKFALARYNVRGTLDTTFGGDGKVTTRFRTDAIPNGVAIQADRRIVAVGGVGGAGGRFAVARYDPDGTLDTSFGGDGKVTTNFTAEEDVASAVAIQSDGRIVAAGKARGNRFALARYLTA
jgi:uncharacterized delta-60 repeat protein